MDWLKEARTATYTPPGFKFAEGGALDIRLHYRTLGVLAPDRRNGVLMLHGTTGASRQFLQPSTADFLFAEGQPLDVSKYFIVMPDAIGHCALQQAERRIGDRLSTLLLRRHRRGATSPCEGSARIATAAIDSGHEHGAARRPGCGASATRI
jgi:hypothetical protein